jgi:signal transduction histidine kinase
MDEGEEQEQHESLPRLALVLAHRIRGLVTSIGGFTDLLVEGLTSSEQRELALHIIESSEKIEDILAELQRYGEPVQLVQREVPVRAVIDDVFSELTDQDLERITLDLQVAKPCRIVVDPVLLRRVLVILLQNAFEADRSGGTVVLSVRSLEDENRIQFDIRNQGFIDLDDAGETVFMPFYTTKANNLGIGLTMARRIIEAHNGEVWLSDNGASVGTCFSVRLPQQAGE